MYACMCLCEYWVHVMLFCCDIFYSHLWRLMGLIYKMMYCKRMSSTINSNKAVCLCVRECLTLIYGFLHYPIVSFFFQSNFLYSFANNDKINVKWFWNVDNWILLWEICVIFVCFKSKNLLEVTHLKIIN